MREVERLSRLVDDLLDLSRIESGAVELKLADVDVPELIRSAVEAFEAEAREKRIHVELDLARDVPTVRADWDRVYQVMANLLSNALRFSGADGKIAIGAWEADGQVRVEVRDTGPGIPAADLDRIFEPCFTTRSRGTGLGLAIARMNVIAHAGTIEAVPAPDGAQLRIVLPLVRPG